MRNTRQTEEGWVGIKKKKENKLNFISLPMREKRTAEVSLSTRNNDTHTKCYEFFCSFFHPRRVNEFNGKANARESSCNGDSLSLAATETHKTNCWKWNYSASHCDRVREVSNIFFARSLAIRRTKRNYNRQICARGRMMNDERERWG